MLTTYDRYINNQQITDRFFITFPRKRDIMGDLKFYNIFSRHILQYHLHAICTMFMPQSILQTQPTIMRKVTICRNAERRLRRKAFTFLLIIVGAPHKAANADIAVPVIDKKHTLQLVKLTLK